MRATQDYIDFGVTQLFLLFRVPGHQNIVLESCMNHLSDFDLSNIVLCCLDQFYGLDKHLFLHFDCLLIEVNRQSFLWRWYLF